MALLADEVVSEATRALGVLSRYGRVAGAFVFGSQAEGTAGPDSDLDLAAFIEGAGDWDIRQEVDICCTVQREVSDDIDLHIFPASALGAAEPASLAEHAQEHGTPLELGGQQTVGITVLHASKRRTPKRRTRQGSRN